MIRNQLDVCLAFLSDIEESPKWKVLSEILDEIKTDSESAGKSFSVIFLS